LELACGGVGKFVDVLRYLTTRLSIAKDRREPTLAPL
jgi:hypothetical protein